jgi:Fe-S cluster assembly protein SufD
MQTLTLTNGLQTLQSFQIKETAIALSRLTELALPTKKTEEYKYFDIDILLSKKWQIYRAKKVDIKVADIVEIVDGVVVSAPKEIAVSYSAKRDIDTEHFDALYYLGHILSPEVIELHCKSDAKIKIVHRFTQASVLIAYRLQIQTSPNISLHIAESFEGCDIKDTFVLYGYDLHVQRDARVEMIKDETLTEGSYTPIYSNFIDIETQGAANIFSFDFGNADGLQLLRAKLGENSTFNAKHLLYAKGNGKRGTVSHIVHTKKNATSSQKAKNILQDKARGIFDALIKIEQEGGGTKAYQNSQAVLLNDGAYMASKPHLEIYIDDVEASHGSTIGELDEKELFYLRSRGITLQEAKKILILAFANEIIDAIEEKEIREDAHISFENVYYGQSQLECMATCHNCSDIIIGEDS